MLWVAAIWACAAPDAGARRLDDSGTSPVTCDAPLRVDAPGGRWVLHEADDWAGVPTVPFAVDGDLELRLDATGAAWLEALDGLCAVTGDLEVTGDGGARHAAGDLGLPALREVGGDLYVHDVATVFGAHATDALVSVGGDLRLHDLRGLVGVSFDRLVSVGGTVSLRGVPALRLTRWTRLAHVGGFVHDPDTWHDVLEQIALPALRSVDGDLRLGGLAGLDEVVLPELDTVGGTLSVAGGCAARLEVGARVGRLELGGLCAVDRMPDVVVESSVTVRASGLSPAQVHGWAVGAAPEARIDATSGDCVAWIAARWRGAGCR